jgi:pimeloyl-ACP methyl ester carboxylesterase
MAFRTTNTVSTEVLDIGYEAAGPGDGPVAVLLHGFPYDVRSFDSVAARLSAQGIRVIAPYLRGFGPTRFRSAATLRSGQQAALGRDLLDMLDALNIDSAIVGGFDWGGRAACIAAALAPERIAGLVTVGGYNIQDIANANRPSVPEMESAAWYTHYFMTERGRLGLERFRDELCKLLWTQWSPNWSSVQSAFPLTAPSFANPDFVDVVIHSYRHRRQEAEGDPRYAELESILAKRPPISVPTISLDALADGLGPDDSEDDRELFSGRFEIRRLEGVGHNPPQEQPDSFSDAVLTLLR